MSIRLQDIIKAIVKEVYDAQEYLKKEKIPVVMPEAEITLYLETELDGEEEKKEIDTKKIIKKYGMNEKDFKEKGLSFRKIYTVHNHGKEEINLVLRIVVIPDEKMR